MSIIVHYGNLLAQNLNKESKSGAICGFLRLSIKKIYGEEVMEKITPEILKNAMQSELAGSLKKINFENVDQAISETINDIERNKSLFTMSNA